MVWVPKLVRTFLGGKHPPESLPLWAGAACPSSPAALSSWGKDGVHAVFLPAGSSIQSPSSFPCAHSTRSQTTHLALSVLREEEGSSTAGKPLCLNAQSMSNLCTSCLHCVIFGAGSVFSVVPKPVPAGCTESHQQLICWLTAGGFVCAALPSRAARWPGHGTHQATPAFPGSVLRALWVLTHCSALGQPPSHSGLGTSQTHSRREAQYWGLGSGTVQGRNW